MRDRVPVRLRLLNPPEAAPSGVEEWPATLDLDAVVESGFRPQPFGQFVLKLIERCDLACDYCYMFAMADQGWRRQPAVMGRGILEAAARRIGEHAAAHELPSVEVVLHGGEPLLAGPRVIDEAATVLRRWIPGEVALRLQMVSNGVRLDRSVLEVADRHAIRIAISLDGARAAQDRHRTFADGRGSFEAVERAVRLLRQSHHDLFAGLLAVIDLANDPVETYEALLAHGPPVVDLCLPHGTWSAPPPGVMVDDPRRTTPYGDWLAAVFDRWYPRARKETTVRLLEQIMVLLLGGRSSSETVGLSPAATAFVNTDGSIEQVDTLRAAADGAVRTGLTVERDGFDDALWHPGIVARQLGLAALSGTCRGCSLRQVCGGGYFPHRYEAGSGYRNPSVYCRDLSHLIGHVDARVRQDLHALYCRLQGP